MYGWMIEALVWRLPRGRVRNWVVRRHPDGYYSTEGRVDLEPGIPF